MKRYIEADAVIKKVKRDIGLTRREKSVIMRAINYAPTADVVEVTDKSMIPLVKDFIKDLEKLGGRATCNNIIKSMKR